MHICTCSGVFVLIVYGDELVLLRAISTRGRHAYRCKVSPHQWLCSLLEPNAGFVEEFVKRYFTSLTCDKGLVFVSLALT